MAETLLKKAGRLAQVVRKAFADQLPDENAMMRRAAWHAEYLFEEQPDFEVQTGRDRWGSDALIKDVVVKYAGPHPLYPDIDKMTDTYMRISRGSEDGILRFGSYRVEQSINTFQGALKDDKLAPIVDVYYSNTMDSVGVCLNAFRDFCINPASSVRQAREQKAADAAPAGV